MTMWNTLQAIGSALGGITFIAVVVALFFHEKLKDWFLSEAELRTHRLAVVREHDRANTELRSKIVLELFSRKIKAHDLIRSHAIKTAEAANLAHVVASEEPDADTSPKVEALRQAVMNSLEAFHHSYRGFEADLSTATVKNADDFARALSLELFPALRAKHAKAADKLDKSSAALMRELFDGLHLELQQLYSEGFEKLLKHR